MGDQSPTGMSKIYSWHTSKVVEVTLFAERRLYVDTDDHSPDLVPAESPKPGKCSEVLTA